MKKYIDIIKEESFLIKSLFKKFDEVSLVKKLNEEDIVLMFKVLQKEQKSIFKDYEISLLSMPFRFEIFLKDKFNKNTNLRVLTVNVRNSEDKQEMEVFSVLLDSKKLLDNSIMLSYGFSDKKFIYMVTNVKNQKTEMFHVFTDEGKNFVKRKELNISKESLDFQVHCKLGLFLNNPDIVNERILDVLFLGKELSKEENELMYLREEFNLMDYKDSFINIKELNPIIVNNKNKKKSL